MANALDQETRKITSSKIESGKEQELLQATQKQLMAIQAERSQNLAVARAESKAVGDINQTLSQAAEIGSQVAAENSQASPLPVVNPATIGILNKYGLGAPHFQKTSTQSQQVTKQNIVINNNTTTNTTNNVQVPANIGGPIQGRPLAFKPKVENDSTGKFKAWISAAFSRQSEEGARRDREYRNRELSLSKSAGKMMKKLEELGRTVSTRLDPRRIGTTVMSQLKTLLFVLGIGFMAQNWPKILGYVADIEAGFKKFLRYMGVGVEGKSEFHQKLVTLLGGNPQSENAFQALRKLIYNEDPQSPGMIQELGKYLSDKISERREAMKLVKFPDIDLGDLPGTLKQIGGYLGDLLTAMVSGSEGVKNSISRQIERTATSESNQYISSKDELLRKTWDKKITDASGEEQKVDTGTMALFGKGEDRYRGLTKRSLDSRGELDTSYGAEATVSQGEEISKLLLDAKEGKRINTAQVSTGLRRLKTAADNEGMIPVSLEFLNNILTPEERKQLGEKDIAVREYQVVARKKTDKDKSIEDSIWWQEGVEDYSKASLIDKIPLARGFTAANEAVEGAASQVFNPMPGSSIAHAGFRFGLNYLRLNPTVSAAFGAGRGAWNNWVSNDYRLEVVKEPREGDIPTGQTQKVVEISPRVVQKIADKISGIQDVKIDTGSQEFTGGIENYLVGKRQAKISQDIEELKKENETVYGYSPMADNSVMRFKNDTEIQKLQAELGELESGGGPRDIKISETYGNLTKLEKLEEKHKTEREDTDSRREKAAREITQTGIDVYNSVVGALPSDLGIKPIQAKGGGDYASQEEINRRINVSMAHLQKKGLSKSAASGVVGNLLGEGLRLKDLGKEHPDGVGKNAGPSAGIAQFHSYYNGNKGELDFLKEYAARNNKDWTKLETQLDYLVEGSRDSKNTLEKIRKRTEGLNENDSIAESARIWGHDYERFSGFGNMKSETYKTRIGFGKGVYESSTGEKLEIQSSSDNPSTTPEEEPRSLIQMFIDNIKSFVLGAGNFLGQATGVATKVGDDLKDKAIEALGGIKPVETYRGPITPEFTSYSEYKKNPGSLPPGMSYVQWGTKVFNLTGSSPFDLIAENRTKKTEETYFPESIKRPTDEEPKKSFWETLTEEEDKRKEEAKVTTGVIPWESLDRAALLTEKEKLEKDYKEKKISRDKYLEGLSDLYAIKPEILSEKERLKKDYEDKKISHKEYLEGLADLYPIRPTQYQTYEEYYVNQENKSRLPIPIIKERGFSNQDIMNLSESEYKRLSELYKEANSDDNIFAQKVASEYGVDIKELIPTNKVYSEFLGKLGETTKFENLEDSPFEESVTPEAKIDIKASESISPVSRMEETTKELKEAISDNTKATIGQTQVEAKSIGVELEPGNNIFTKILTGELMEKGGDPKMNLLRTISDNVGELVLGSNKLQEIQKIGVRTTAKVVDASRETANATLQSAPMILQAAISSNKQIPAMPWQSVSPNDTRLWGDA